MRVGRRTVLQNASFATLVFMIGQRQVWLTPREARAASVPFRTLTPDQIAILNALGDTLLPGAAEAGIAHFVDQQISIEPRDALLTLRYLDVAPPFSQFYQQGFAALDATSQALYRGVFVSLENDQRHDLVRRMVDGTPPGWNGIPAPLFYFALRSDAVDVVYGTVEGFQKLNVPYMPHILPNRRW
jgi:Gluconate 2-dehydrogenase subunit 3